MAVGQKISKMDSQQKLNTLQSSTILIIALIP